MTKCKAESLLVTADTHNWIHTGAAPDYGYDAAGNMTSDPTDGVTASYDAENRIATATKNGATTTYTYDDLGNIRAIKDPLTHTTSYDYTNANYPHYITGIRDPRGLTAARSLFDDSGRLIGDFTVGNAGCDRFFVFGSGIAEQYHLRWFEAHLPPTGVAIRALRTELLGLGIAGPNENRRWRRKRTRSLW